MDINNKDIKQKIIQACENFALNEWLSDYPENLSYDEILALLEVDKWSDPRPDDYERPQVTECYLIEGHSGDQIAGFISDTYYSAVRMMKGVINEL